MSVLPVSVRVSSQRPLPRVLHQPRLLGSKCDNKVKPQTVTCYETRTQYLITVMAYQIIVSNITKHKNYVRITECKAVFFDTVLHYDKHILIQDLTPFTSGRAKRKEKVEGTKEESIVVLFLLRSYPVKLHFNGSTTL